MQNTVYALEKPVRTVQNFHAIDFLNSRQVKCERDCCSSSYLYSDQNVFVKNMNCYSIYLAQRAILFNVI